MLTAHIQRLSPDLTRSAPKRREQHFNWIFGTKYSRMDQVKFVEDSL